MKKALAVLCAGLLLACCVALGACSNGSSNSSAASESASTSASSSSVDPMAKFVGEWHLAALRTDGVTVPSGSGEAFGDIASMAITINADGTGLLSFSGESVGITWTMQDENTIDLVLPETMTGTANITYEDGALFMNIASDMFTGTAILTPDGIYAKAPNISIEDASPITSADELIGSWTLCGISKDGMSAYGDEEFLKSETGGMDVQLVFNEDGTGTFIKSKINYTVTPEGTSMSLGGNMSIPVMRIGDCVIVDVQSTFGMPLAFAFTK